MIKRNETPEYKKIMTDLSINQNDLLKEALTHPQKYYEYAVEVVYASSQTQIEKNKLEVVKADADIEVRKNPKKFGLTGKVLEAAIKAAITKHPKVVLQTSTFLSAHYKEKLLEEARMAIYHKKKMIEVAAQLDLRLHFSEPSISGEAKNVMLRSTSESLKKGLKLSRRK